MSYKESCWYVEMLLPAVSLQVNQNLWLTTFLLDHRTYLFLPHLSTWVTHLSRWLEDDSSILQQLLRWAPKQNENKFLPLFIYLQNQNCIRISCLISTLLVGLGRGSQLRFNFLPCPRWNNFFNLSPSNMSQWVFHSPTREIFDHDLRKASCRPETQIQITNYRAFTSKPVGTSG